MYIVVRNNLNRIRYLERWVWATVWVLGTVPGVVAEMQVLITAKPFPQPQPYILFVVWTLKITFLVILKNNFTSFFFMFHIFVRSCNICFFMFSLFCFVYLVGHSCFCKWGSFPLKASCLLLSSPPLSPSPSPLSLSLSSLPLPLLSLLSLSSLLSLMPLSATLPRDLQESRKQGLKRLCKVGCHLRESIVETYSF